MTHILFVLLFIVTAAVSPVVADCDRPRSALTALNRADVVFRGTVHAIRRVGAPGFENITPRGTESSPGWTGWIVELDVVRVWKGVVGKRFVLHVAREGEDDAYEYFERGTEYLVFATQNPPTKAARFGLNRPTYGAHGCGGTTSMLWATRYLLDLGVGRTP